MRTLKYDIDDENVKNELLRSIIANVDELDGRTPGILFAQQLLDKILETAGPVIYQRGVRDTRKLVQNKIDDLATDLDLLEN